MKLIGATAHFVTSDLDEGPIIAQDVERVDHAMIQFPASVLNSSRMPPIMPDRMQGKRRCAGQQPAGAQIWVRKPAKAGSGRRGHNEAACLPRHTRRLPIFIWHCFYPGEFFKIGAAPGPGLSRERQPQPASPLL